MKDPGLAGPAASPFMMHPTTPCSTTRPNGGLGAIRNRDRFAPGASPPGLPVNDQRVTIQCDFP